MAEAFDFFGRYAASFAAGWKALFVTALGLTLVALAARRGIPEPLASRLTRGWVPVVALLAVLHAWALRWLCDDAFISFRYAENWVRGHGLVFNPGERVEGYTNFLFTTAIAAGALLGAHPGWFSMLLTLSSLAGTLIVAAALARRLLPSGAMLPGLVACASLAASYTFASFGTSGLETMPATFLLLLAVERAEANAPLVAGFAGILAALAHPDHLLLYAGLGAALLSGSPRRLRSVVLFAIPLVFVFIPYYLVRYSYYGDFFPNTYYAKSGGAAYFSQGFAYLGMSALSAGLLGVLPLALIGAYRHRSRVFGRFVLVALPLYLLYVAKIGGDFMLGRLLCVVLPPFFVAAELTLREWLVSSPRRLGLLGLGVFAPIALPNGTLRPQEYFHGVCDERTWYPLKSLRPLVIDEEFSHRTDALLAAFRGAPRPPKLAFCCVGIIGYRTGFPMIDDFGLVTRAVAHMPLVARGRPGHEKVAGAGFSFEHDVDFSGNELWPKEYKDQARLSLGGFDYSLAKYDERLLRAVATNGRAAKPDLEARIAEYSPLGRDKERIACDLWFFNKIYFRHNRNEPLSQALVAKIVREQPALVGLEELLVEVPNAERTGFEGKTLFAFEDFQDFTVRGAAFERGPSRREAAGQDRVVGQRGRFANSYRSPLGDEGKGTLVSPKFVLRGDALSFRIGGGFQPGNVVVRLVVANKTLDSATGCDSELLGLRWFPIGEAQGQEARLEIVDRSRAPWGHVLVDEVVEWHRVR